MEKLEEMKKKAESSLSKIKDIDGEIHEMMRVCFCIENYNKFHSEWKK